VGQYADGAVTWTFSGDAGELRPMFDTVLESWKDHGRTGAPRLMTGCYYAVGPTAEEDLAAYFHDYYPPIMPGMVDQLLGSVRTVSDAGIKDVVASLRDIGCDEVIMQPIKPTMDQLDRLADLVL
jgi:alkanesulfonate monooxygenase SsuD/methylene tetrahydromethanopterin reductase-like flavin-dependent oxidoreductase (luciferase family)